MMVHKQCAGPDPEYALTHRPNYYFSFHQYISIMRINKFNKAASLLPLMFMLAALLFTSCKPDDPVDPNEEELITKVQLTFTDLSNSSNTFTAIFSDPDGPGGAGPTQFDTIRLDSGAVYAATIALYDESDPGHA